MQQKILLLHGALGSKKQLESIKGLLENQYEAYSLNFEGHGSFESEQAYSMDLFTKNIVDFLDHESIEQVNLFGYSMGGYVALNTALHFPDRIGKIITLGTKFDWSLESATQEIKMLNPDIIEAKVPRFAEKLKTEHQPQDWKVVMQKTAGMMKAMADGKKLQNEDFKLITKDVTIGIGNADKMVSVAESEHVVQLLPQASLQVLDGVEHPIDKVDPKVVADYITQSIGE